MGKVVEAIAIPNDGPLLSKERKSHGQVGITEALDLLSKAEGKVLKDLLGSSTIKDQLSCLRSYRSTLLNLQNKSKMGDQKSTNQAQVVGGSSENPILLDDTVIGMYRILLELVFSSGAPHALKRASESCLVALQLCHSDMPTYDAITESVVRSLLHYSPKEEECVWMDPVQTLFDIFLYTPSLAIILKDNDLTLSAFNLLLSQGLGMEETLKNHYHRYHDYEAENKEKHLGENISVLDRDVVDTVMKGVAICTTLKLILSEIERQKLLFASSSNDIGFTTKLNGVLLSLLTKIVIPMMRCKASSSDALSVCSIALGHVFLTLWNLNCNDGKSMAKCVLDLISLVTSVESKSHNVGGDVDHITRASFDLKGLPQLNKTAIVRGLAATLPNEVLSKKLFDGGESLLLDPIASFILNLAQTSSDNAVRLSSIKGLETILARCQKLLLPSSEGGVERIDGEEARKLSMQVLKVSLATWECPPSRQVGSAVPGLFQSLVKLMEILDSKENERLGSINLLVSKVIAQPANRKGRFIALDALLPKVGATKLLQLAENVGNEKSIPLVESLIQEIGRPSTSSNVVGELLAKLLSMLRVEMHEEAGIDLRQNIQGNKKDRRKKEQLLLANPADRLVAQNEKEVILLLDEWNNVWMPSLVNALISSDESFRTRISSFFLPLFPLIMGGKGNKLDLSHAFAILLQRLEQKSAQAENCDQHAFMWAKFEIVRHATSLKILKSPSSSIILRKAVAHAFPIESLTDTLCHEKPRLRLVAFQSIGSILFAYENVASDPVHLMKAEADLWRGALPYALKCSEKEYIVVLSKSLMEFLTKMSDVEASCYDDNRPERSLTEAFVNDFLLQDIFVKQSAYPSTVAEKEKWALSMFDIVISFASQKLKNSATKVKNTKRDGNRRAMLPVQECWYKNIMSFLLTDDVMAPLLTLLQSMWDSTRSLAHDTVLRVLEYAHQTSIQLPKIFTDGASFQLFQARGIHLASSPRQREADTGARMISILCATLPSSYDRFLYVKNLSVILARRIAQMEISLGQLLNDNGSPSSEREELPLAHGLLQAIRLIIDNSSFMSIPDTKDSFDEIIASCFRAIKLSLHIVADTKNDSNDNCDLRKATQAKEDEKVGDDMNKNVPLNVNTGAIGANATFASLETVDEDELSRRLLMQRVVMGTWLLIKEACSTLSSSMEASPVKDPVLLSKAGDILMKTLTSLKHQGAAFASHKSLQKLCSICYEASSSPLDSGIRELPSNWSQRFLHEISSAEVVRDSTLRRSTGYGLGFLSVLRSEQVSPRFLFPVVLANLIRLSLPSAPIMEKQLASWNSSENDIFMFFSKIDFKQNARFVSHNDYEDRTRIHALNILRLIILDAPLASEMREFVGDSIISALIGYKDSSWAIRNSATMTFAAAMLRVVDADKNAEAIFNDVDVKASSNAVTCRELFRSYPSLAPCLLKLIRKENASVSSNDSMHPNLFPLLLLLARLQPLSLQRTHGDEDDTSILFIDPIIQCLGHPHHKVRLVASRALSVLCSGDSDTNNCSSRRTILDKCLEHLSFHAKNTLTRSYNQDHGVLLALRSLLSSAPQPEKYFHGALKDAIIYYSTWSNFTFATPPSCAAIAIEILYMLTLRSQSAMNDLLIHETKPSTLQEISFKLVRCVEELSSRGDKMDVVGLSDLAKAASKVTAQLAFRRIFDFSTTSKFRERYLKLVKHCFCSSNYDIMLYSVKAFKKGIYAGVDQVVEDTSKNCTEKNDILIGISALSIQSICALIDRDQLKAHPPTIRRLSRIALECIYATKSLPSNSLYLSDIIGIKVETFWSTLRQMLHLGGFVLNQGDSKPENLSGGNGLAGNALELTALALDEFCSESKELQACKSDLLQERTFLFIDLLKQSVHPLSSWKIRYSAALGARESGLLSSSMIDNNMIGESTKNARTQVYLLLLELLQDSDEDVRRATGQALSKSSNSSPIVALKTFEIASQMLSFSPSSSSSSEMLLLLIHRLVHLCKEAELNLKFVTEELSSTIDIPEVENNLNLSTKRKIFENEDPNPYQELLVMIQMSIIRLLEYPVESVIDDDEIETLFVKIYSSCELVLTEIKHLSLDANKLNDFAHNLTFDSRIFPYFHGLLIGSTVGLWFGIQEKNTNIIDSASVILQSGAIIHPCIKQALGVLEAVKNGDTDVRKEIIQSCFILPSVAS